MILAPSRELVLQISQVFQNLFAGTSYRAISLIGGTNVKKQLQQLKEIKPQVVIATPGRFAEITFRYEKISLVSLTTLILDEVDYLLQEPYEQEIKTIIEASPLMKASRLDSTSNSISNNNKKYVLCLVSATANNNPAVTQLMEDYSVANQFTAIPPSTTTVSAAETSQVSWPRYQKAIVSHAGLLPATITHAIISAPRIKAFELLKKLLQAKPELNRGLIFVNSPYQVEVVYQKLLSLGFIVAPLHGDSSKEDRKEILSRLRDGRLRLVVTTELSARGLDLPEVTHVINFELPTDALHYIHRVGRCGRAGRPGLAVNFCTPETKFVIRRFGKQLGTKVFDCEMREGQVFLKMG